MSARTIAMTDALHAYLVEVSAPQTDLMRRLRDETAAMPRGGMQISAEQGQFMRLLVELTGAKKALEVGVFTGYSGLAVAEAMGPEGRLIACDISEEFTAVARRYWAEAGVADRIDLRIGPAVETLATLEAEGHAGTFDFAFIDADKGGYDAYYEATLRLLRPGGLLGIDNTLWSGRVADPSDDSPDTLALRALNAKLAADERVTVAVVPIGDGLTLARKR